MRWPYSYAARKADIFTYFSVEGMLGLKKKRSPMAGSTSWQELYTAAMLELDRAALQSRIEAAQAAIQQAMEELAGNRKVGTGEE